MTTPGKSTPHTGAPTPDPQSVPTPNPEAAPTPSARPAEGSATASGGQQLADGARQMAAGARQIYGSHVAPAVKSGVGQVRTAYTQGSAEGGALSGIQRVAGPALAALGILGVLALFLPVASALGMSIGWFSSEAPEGEGAMLLVAFLLTAALGVVAFLLKRTWVRVTAGIVAIIVGLLAMADGFGSVVRMQEASGFVSPGASLYLIGLVGLGMLVAGVLLLIPSRGKKPSATA